MVTPWNGLRRAVASDPAGVGAVLRVADALDWSRAELAWVCEFESGHTFSPSALGRDSRGIEYSGLIQIGSFNLSAIGWRGTPAAFRALTLTEQAPYVETYLRKTRARWQRPGDLYIAVAGPKYLGKPDATIVGPVGGRVWNDNPAWRPASGGPVTVGSIRRIAVNVPPGAPVEFERWVPADKPVTPGPRRVAASDFSWLLLLALADSGRRHWT
jgi:hypothetical protein